MKGMRKFLFMMALAALVATLATTTSSAQIPTGHPATDPFFENRTRFSDDGSKVFPAGTVNEPGSQLLYLVDFGLLADADKAVTAIKAGQPNTFTPTNFISVTNVHPTAAVTVHVRYLNNDCRDVLDFLVVLTCNDVWMFNPFDLNIPGPNGQPTGTRAFDQLTATQRSLYSNDGRFLIFISASGAFDLSPITVSASGLQPAYDGDSSTVRRANILFPNPVYTANNEIGGSVPLTGYCGVENGLGGRLTAGAILNVLTARNISFNYLIGSQTIATALQTTGAAAGERRSFGHEAWARPAVVFDRRTLANRSATLSGGAGTVFFNNIGYDRDGDGLQAAWRVILAGEESVPDVLNSSTRTNDNFLRSEIQNGFYEPFLSTSLSQDLVTTTITTRVGWRVRGGALAWDRIFPTDDNEVTGAIPSLQILNFISVEDDYSGQKNFVSGAILNDRSASFEKAHTLLSPGIFNNAEVPFNIPVPGVIISPPSQVGTTNLIAVACINAFLSDANFNPVGAILGKFTLTNLFSVGADPAALRAFLATPTADPAQGGGADLSTGWVRFNRLRQELFDTAAFNRQSPANRVSVGSSSLPVSVTSDRLGVNPRQHSFVLLGRFNIQFRELGAAYWMHGVSDEFTSIGDPTP
ncbi:MAG: hypothetical protein HY644_00870 [Acidobacteria bacterium]|nr:hypothetical protein [Acidobacteriota bacterium]